MDRARLLARAAFGAAIALVAPAPAARAQPATTHPAAAAQPAAQPAPAGTLTLAPITVTAEKRDEALQDVPASVSVLTAEQLRDAHIQDLRDAGNGRVPNLIFSQFSAPRETFPFIRGIGSGQNYPAVTTYYDGVPQLSFSTANLQFLNVERVEFLRGPQSTLYGRNSLGGVINVNSHKPTNDFMADAQATVGNYGLQDYRVNVAGPIVRDNLYFSVSGGFLKRDGFTINNFTGNPLDDRDDVFGRAELRWTPTKELELRLMANAEKDRDGDFPLGDLGAIRAHPRRVDHDYEGSADRTVTQYALAATYHGDRVDLTSVSAYQSWNSHETTDLDETAADLLRRSHDASEHNLIEELRASSPTDKPIVLSPNAKIAWLAGVFAFRQDQNDAPTNIERNPAALGQPVPFPFSSVTDSDILNWGVGGFGQATLTLWDKLDVTAGGRYDYERAHGKTTSFTAPAISPPASTDDARAFDQFSPKLAVGYHWTKDLLTYASAAKGYKAGGFNSVAPAGNVGFGPERSWDYEVGVKSSWLDDRLVVNADVFYIDWRDMQLDVPLPGGPSQFFINNVGKSTSKGVELEVTARPLAGWDLFGGVGYTNAEFRKYPTGGAGGGSPRGNNLPFAPEITWNAGTQLTIPIRGDLHAFARAEVLGVGRYFYDATNAAQQSSYILTNFRLGIGGEHWRVEGFLDNAFNSHYVPIAFPFPGLAPSGYVGESGSPQTAGVTLSVSF